MLAARSCTRTVAPLLLGVLVWGCSTSAAIERRSGPTVVGRIDYSDAGQLYLTTRNDERFAIERADVVYVDHPGKIGMVIGAVTSGVGLGFLAVSPFLRDGCGPDYSSPSPCWNLRAISATIGIGYLLAGVPILLGNLAVYSRSQAALKPQHSADPVPAKWQSP
jgi:hypothetical protein